MEGVLSVPALVILAWGMAGILWWDHRRRVIAPRQVSSTMAAMALVALAMGLLIATLPGRPIEQLVRIALLVEGVYGFWALARRRKDFPDRGR